MSRLLRLVVLLYFAAYLHVGLVLAQAVRPTSVAHEDEVARAVAQDRRAFWLTPGAYVLVSVAVLVLSLI